MIALCVRWYLRFSLSYRDLEELMAERGLSVDHTTVWRWVQRYAPELDRRVRAELKRTGTSWRVDETYVRVAGRWAYLYRAVDSSGATLDFYLSENRDAGAAQQFFCKVLAAANHPRPRVINVDGNPSHPKVVKRQRQKRRLGRRCRCRTCPYLNNILEQDHQRQARLPIVRGSPANHLRL
jgi:transposase-like protein